MGALERRQSAYLGALAKLLDKEKACAEVGFHPRSLFRWRKEDEAFRAAEARILRGETGEGPASTGDPYQDFLAHYRATEKLVESCDAAGIELEDLDRAKLDPEFAEAIARIDRRRRHRALDAIYGKARTGDAASAKAFLDRMSTRDAENGGNDDGGLLDEERDALSSFSEENGGSN